MIATCAVRSSISVPGLNDDTKSTLPSQKDLASLQKLNVPIPTCECERISLLRETHLLDSEVSDNDEYSRYTNLISRILHTPIALVSLMDIDRQWFKARVGLDVPETHRDVAFCSYVLLESSPDVLTVYDALQDPRFAENPLVLGFPFIRFYAGSPLFLNGIKIGTLCVIDQKPRTPQEFGAKEMEMLKDVTAMISTLVRERHRDQLAVEIQVAKMTINVLHNIEQPLKILTKQAKDLQRNCSQSNERPGTCGYNNQRIVEVSKSDLIQFRTSLEVTQEIIDINLRLAYQLIDCHIVSDGSHRFLPLTKCCLREDIIPRTFRIISWIEQLYHSSKSKNQHDKMYRASEVVKDSLNLFIEKNPLAVWFTHCDLLVLVLTFFAGWYEVEEDHAFLQRLDLSFIIHEKEIALDCGESGRCNGSKKLSSKVPFSVKQDSTADNGYLKLYFVFERFNNSMISSNKRNVGFEAALKHWLHWVGGDVEVITDQVESSCCVKLPCVMNSEQSTRPTSSTNQLLIPPIVCTTDVNKEDISQENSGGGILATLFGQLSSSNLNDKRNKTKVSPESIINEMVVCDDLPVTSPFNFSNKSSKVSCISPVSSVDNDINQPISTKISARLFVQQIFMNAVYPYLPKQ